MGRNMESIHHLLHIGGILRRTNASKWGFTLDDWQAAVNAGLQAASPSADESVAEAERAVKAAVRRLSNSGEARFASASVGCNPDTSLAGRRFVDDLEALRDCVEKLRRIHT